MQFAYVIGKYRDKHPYLVDRNIRAAREVGEELAAMGYFPVIPHVMTGHFDGIQDDNFWLEGTLELLRRTADIVVVLPSWVDSTGSRGKSLEAAMKGLQVFMWPGAKEILRERLRNDPKI